MRARSLPILVYAALALTPAFGGEIGPARTPAFDPTDPCASSPIAGARQVILSISPRWNSTHTVIQGFDQGPKGWSPPQTAFEGVLGRNGLAWGIGRHANPEGADLKREGDGRAPAGAFALTGMFGYDPAADQGLDQPESLDYLQSGADSRCVDDGASSHYNHVIPDATTPKDWNSSEDMRRSDDLYRHGIVVDHNRVNAPASQAGRDRRGGSCIFLHVWQGAGSTTSGCTAMPADQIQRLQHWLRRNDAPMLVQLPLEEYLRRREEWCLPEMHVNEWVPPLVTESRALAEGGIRAPEPPCP